MNPVPFTTLAAAMDFVVGDRNYPLSELFMKGGFIMWPLLLLSIAGVVVLVMCCFSTRAAAVLPTKLVEQAESFIRKRDYTGLSILCKNGDSCYARVMLTVANFMLRNPSAQFEEVREIASAEGGRQAGFLSRQISWLSDIGALAPMLGAARAGQRIDLTAKEFALLELLLRRQGEVLPRSLIASQVWDMNFDSDTNVIEVAVKRLRAKMDDGFEPKLIRTVRGMGYVLEIPE